MAAAKKIADHLEFLGYTIETSKAEDEKLIYVASHASLNNILFFDIVNHLTFLQVSLNADKRLTTQMVEYVNDMSARMDVSRIYVFENDSHAVTVRMETAYTGEYDKATFGELLGVYEKDQQRFSTLENFDKVWL